MSVFPRYVATALPAVALVLLCAGCPGTDGTDDGTDVTPPANPCQPNPCTAPNKTDCSVSNGQAVCSCVAGYTPQGDGCAREPTPTCAGQHSLGDAYEPDECPALARTVSTADTSERHTLTSSTDQDWFRIDALEGTVYQVSTVGDGDLSLRVDVYGADGTQLYSENGSSSGTKMVFKARASAPLYARVLATYGDTLGAYTVSFSQPMVTDDYADEPAQVTGTALTPDGTARSGAFQFFGDQDVVRVKLEAGHAYRFEAAWSSPTLLAVLRLELLGPDGTAGVLSAESDSPPPRFIYRAATAGEYFVRVSERTGKQREAYTFKVTDLGLDDQANQPSQAGPIAISASDTAFTAGKLEYAEDVDVFSFQAEAGHIYQFVCDPLKHFTCDAAFVNEAGGVKKPGTASAGILYVADEFDAAGTVYVRVTATGSFTDGGYQWLLKDLGKDDYGDTVSTATPAPLPLPTTATAAKFELPNDIDVIAFPVQAGHIYEVTCTATGVSCNVAFQTAAGSSLRSASGTKAVVQYKFATTDLYLVRLLAVSAPPSTKAYDYTWLLKDLGTDDHGESLDTATPITPSTTPTQGKLEYAGDEDWFSFQAQATQAFSFTCDSGSAFNCNLALMNSGGTELVADNSSNLNAEVIYRMTTAGTYYVRLRSLADTNATYNFQLTDRGVDDHADTLPGATALTLGSARDGKLQVAADVDFFSVTLAASTAYTATLATASSNVTFKVYGPDKVTLLASGSGAQPFTSGAAGVYYVRVEFLSTSASTANVLTPYTMTVK